LKDSRNGNGYSTGAILIESEAFCRIFFGKKTKKTLFRLSQRLIFHSGQKSYKVLRKLFRPITKFCGHQTGEQAEH
jgi:hypothetical protein